MGFGIFIRVQKEMKTLSVWKHYIPTIGVTNSNATTISRFRFMVFNATFNTISVISWRSVLLVEENGVPAENLRPAASH